MKEFYTAYKILVTGGEYNPDTREMDMFDEEFVNKAFSAFKAYVGKTARGTRRERILQAHIHDVKHWGILMRLWYYPSSDDVSYCCGQEWNSEMATLRDCFDRKV